MTIDLGKLCSKAKELMGEDVGCFYNAIHIRNPELGEGVHGTGAVTAFKNEQWVVDGDFPTHKRNYCDYVDEIIGIGGCSVTKAHKHRNTKHIHFECKYGSSEEAEATIEDLIDLFAKRKGVIRR